ncbi:MAG: SEC-C domain-containing protein [Oligoflexales bacterium]|nr:SEC-C domain-containing protein [Oligoflexales bacterium]
MNVGRNDPCSCGSGKKYKKCCLANIQTEKIDEFSYRRYLDIEGKLIDRLFLHAAEVFGPTAIEEAWDEFHCWEFAEGYDPENRIKQVFGPFFLFSWEIDPAATACDLSLVGKTVAESFLSKNRSRLSPEELEILKACNRPIFAFYEIKAVTPGQGFLLMNVLTEEEFEVTERLGSQDAQRGNIIFGAIYDFNGKNKSLTISPYMLPPLALQSLIEVRNILLKRLKTKQLSDADLSDFDIELRELYFEILEPLLKPKRPNLYNTDGDPLLLQTLYFEITNPDEAFSALMKLTSGFIREEELRSEAKIKNGRIQEVEIPWFKMNKSAKHPGSNTVMGTIKINGTKLTAEVNSNKRATTIKKKIMTALGSNVRFKTKMIESIEGNIGREPIQNRTKSSAPTLDQLPPEAQDAIKKMADAHWTKWFDEKIPALNNKTPKQAAKTKEGRELLEALLNFYEQKTDHANNATTNLFEPDVQQLRSKLGLS